MDTSTPVRPSRLEDYWGEGKGTKKEGRGGAFCCVFVLTAAVTESGRVGSDLTFRQTGPAGSYGPLGQRNGPIKDIYLVHQGLVG
jgi:hypothetical protein